MRPADQEMTTPEKIICYSSHAMQGHTGQRPGGSGGQSQRAGQMGARAFIVVFAGRNGRGSKQAKQVGQFECFQKVPGCRSLRSLPDTWSWARGIVAWRARA